MVWVKCFCLEFLIPLSLSLSLFLSLSFVCVSRSLSLSLSVFFSRRYKKEAITDIMKRIESRGYVFQMEIIVRARQSGHTIAEVKGVHLTFE